MNGLDPGQDMRHPNSSLIPVWFFTLAHSLYNVARYVICLTPLQRTMLDTIPSFFAYHYNY